MIKSRTIFSIAIAAAVLSGASTVSAGEDDIKYRKAAMKAVGGHMTAIATILKTDAGDMIDKLTLTFNRTRQAQITSELIEIISGAEAL